MIGEFGVARFGNVDGSHELQKHSSISNEVIRAIQWYTDLPTGPPEAWQPFHAGFPVSDHYVVRYTRPDPSAERAGMVSTTVIVAGTDIYRRSLRPLLYHSAQEPDVDQTCVSDQDSAAPEAAPAGLAGVIDALATSGKAVWLGQAGFSGMVAALWDALAPEDRRRLIFGMVWRPSTIPYPIDDESRALMVFTVPVESRQRFDTWPVVNPSEPAPAGRTAAAALRLESDRAVEMASRLAIEQPTLVEWTRLVEAADFCADLDDLVDVRLREFVHLLAVLAPNQEQGADLKNAVVARISQVTTTAGFAHVRALRTFPASAYPSGPDLPELLWGWAVRTIADSGAIEDLTAAVDAARAAAVDEWSLTLATALKDVARHDPVSTKARLTDLAARDQQETFDWLADACTDQDDFDLDLSTWASSCTPPAWVSKSSLRYGWPMTHALCCDIADPILAWRTHAQIPGRSSVSDGMLASRVGPTGTVTAALSLSDVALLQVAGQLVAQDPALLQPARVADPTWREVWLSSIEAGADPWSVVPAAEAVSQLLDALVEGESVSARLLNAAAESDGADLSGYPRRAFVWEYLPIGIRDRFLERTAHALALSPADQLASLEPILIGAILRPENMESIALLGVERAVDVLEQLADHVTSEAVLAVTKGPKLPADCSRRLGHLVVSGKLKEVAKNLAKRTKNRPDLRLAATKASVLLSLSDRVHFMLRVQGVTPTAEEIQHLAHEFMVKLYNKGPTDRHLWARSGGDPADLPEAPTPRERWRLAADAIATQARGAPTLPDMLDVMIEDYNRKDLKRLRRLL